MKKPPLKKFLTSFAILTTFALVACSGKKSEEGSNKLLRIGTSQEFEILHPIIAQMGMSSYIFQMTNNGIVTIDADWKNVCVLCTTYPTLENKLAKKLPGGKLEVNWELKEDLKWGDGTPVTGHDVKFGWEIGNHPNVSIPFRDIFERVESIEVDEKNPKKFRMVLRKQRYDFASLHTFYLIPKHIEGPVFEATKGTLGQYEKQTKYNTDPTNPGLYFGAYVVSELKLGSHVTLTPNPYALQKPHIQKIIFKYIPNSQSLEANLLAGSIDMIPEPSGMTFDQALSLQERIDSDSKLADRIKITMREGTVFEHVTFNFRDPIVRDIRVRKALAYASDRETLVKALFKDKLKVAHQDTHPLDPYYTNDVTHYPYDLDKANALLDEAGWKLGEDGLRTKDGKPLQLTLMTTAQNKNREQVQVYLQAQWKKIGVDVKIHNEPPRVFFGETVRKGLFPNLAMFAWISSPDNPPQTILDTSSIPTKANGFSGQNSGAFSNKEMDKRFQMINVEFDFEKRKEHMSVIQKIYTDELPALPLYLRAEFAVIPKNLQGFRITGHQFTSSVSVADWHF